MTLALSERVRAAFAPPSYLAFPLAGIDVSTSGVKAARLAETSHGFVLAQYAQARLPLGAYTDGEITDRAAVVNAIKMTARAAGISSAHVSLPESKSYLFETSAPGTTKAEWRTAVEQHLDELIPLPPPETAFDIVGMGPAHAGGTLVAGVGLARRIVDEMLSAFDEAGVGVRSLESEPFAVARAILPADDTSTVLIIDVGKTTTKLSIVTNRVPRFATTIGIGGHALTLAVQKHFGVTEAEARRVKADRGIVPSPGNEDYIAAMLSTVSAIRDEISKRLDYWQGHAASSEQSQPVTRAIIIGGNASLRGLPEYMGGAFKVPVVAGDVFSNLAPRSAWVPELDYNESLAYATSIGLALRDTL